MISLVANAINKKIEENPKNTFAELEESINDFESLLPIRDLIQVPFQDDFGEDNGDDNLISNIHSRVIRILVENQVLDVDNKDKFSGWWDVDQEIVSGTELYQISYPEPRLLKILCEPVKRLSRAMLELIQIIKIHSSIHDIHALRKSDIFLKRNIFYIKNKGYINIRDG